VSRPWAENTARGWDYNRKVGRNILCSKEVGGKHTYVENICILQLRVAAPSVVEDVQTNMKNMSFGKLHICLYFLPNN